MIEFHCASMICVSCKNIVLVLGVGENMKNVQSFDIICWNMEKYEVRLHLRKLYLAWFLIPQGTPLLSLLFLLKQGFMWKYKKAKRNVCDIFSLCLELKQWNGVLFNTDYSNENCSSNSDQNSESQLETEKGGISNGFVHEGP